MTPEVASIKLRSRTKVEKLEKRSINSSIAVELCISLSVKVTSFWSKSCKDSENVVIWLRNGVNWFINVSN